MAKRTFLSIETDIKSFQKEKQAATDKIKDLNFQISKAESEGNVEALKNIKDEIDVANKELNAAKDQIKSLEMEKAEVEAEVKALTNGVNSQADSIVHTDDRLKSLLSSETYAKAFEKAIKTSDFSDVKHMTKTYTSEAAAGGSNAGVFVPTILADMWIEKVKTGGRLFNLCRKLAVKGLYEIPVIVSRTGAQTQSENSTPPIEQSGTFDSVVIKPVNLIKWARLTDELEALTGTMFLEYLGQELFDEILKLADRQIIEGQNGLKGIITNPTTMVPTSNFAGVMSWEKTLTPIGLVADGTEESAVYVMNRKTFYNNVMTLSDLQKKPIYQILTDNTGKPQHFLNGARVYFSDALPAFDQALATDYVMIYGDFNKYLINTPKGQNVDIVRDEKSEAESGLIKYVAKLYAGGGVVGVEAFATMTKGTAV